MLLVVLVTFIDLFSLVFTFLLFIRIILSWIWQNPYHNRFSAGIYELTEPVLAVVRKFLPNYGPFDLAPLLTFFLLQGLVWAGHLLLARAG